MIRKRAEAQAFSRCTRELDQIRNDPRMRDEAMRRNMGTGVLARREKWEIASYADAISATRKDPEIMTREVAVELQNVGTPC